MKVRSHSHLRPGLLHLVLAGLLASIGVAVTWVAWSEIYDLASRDQEYSHIFLVPVLAVWLLWVRRLRISQLRITGTLIGPVTIALGWLVHTLGFNHGGQFAMHFGALMIVVGCVLSVLGKQALFRFLPAVIVLIAIVPMPGPLRQEIAFPLQNWTAKIAQFLMELVHVDTVVSASYMSVNGETVSVEEACNGMRLVFPLLLISYAFAFALPLRPAVRLGLLVASPVVALACNVLRTLPTIYLHGRAGGLTGAQHEAARNFAERFHDISGWAMLPLSFLILLGLIRLLKWMVLPVERYTLAAQP